MEGKTNRELQALLEVQDHKIKQLEQRITTLEWVICTVVDDSEPELGTKHNLHWTWQQGGNSPDTNAFFAPQDSR